MRFLVDRCAGRRLAEWLGNEGHDVLEARTLGPDPGDLALLELANSEDRILVTIDTDFGELIYLHDVPHAGLLRNYAREHWAREGENPPVGLILCSEKDEALARYALEGLSNKVMAAEYRITLPDETVLAAELDRTRQAMELRGDAL